MKKLVAAVVVAVSLSVPSLVNPTSVASAGSCVLTQYQSRKLVVRKLIQDVPATYFDAARGDATVVELDPCTWLLPNNDGGGACILLANLEDKDVNNKIVQVGYCRQNTLAPYKFVYTPSGNGLGVDWPGTLTPVIGHRLRNWISRVPVGGGAFISRYTVMDLTTGVPQTYDGTWPGDILDQAWWGAEVFDTSADLGAKQESGQNINMAYLGYSPNNNSGWIYRTNMTSADVINQGGRSCEHWYIGTWVYGGDKFNVDNNC